MLVFDCSNSGNIHRFLNHKVITLPKDSFYFENVKYIWFADNSYISLNKAIEKAFLSIYPDITIVNSPKIHYWSDNRRISYKIMEKMGFDILNYEVYEDPKTIDVDRWERGVVKLLYSDAGYKNTRIFQSKEELEAIKEELTEPVIIQEFCDGEEVAFGTLFYHSEPILPVYVSFEFKKSISNKIGGNTGQSGEFGFFSSHPFAMDVINKITNYLKEKNIDYTGTIDINGGYKEGKFYPYEFTLSRDGYPEILHFLYGEDIEEMFSTKKRKKNNFTYSLIIRADFIENEKKEYKFKVNEEAIKEDGFVFIPEAKQKEDYYITRDPHIIGILYKESDKVEEIKLRDYFDIPVIYYSSFNEDIQRKWEAFKWLKE